MRIEPPPSVPSASAAIPAATAAALPPLEPPGSRAGLRGLRVKPSADWVNPHTASSGIRVLPTTTAPARRSRLTSSSSRRAGAVEVAADPWRVACPATGTLSFTATGTPASGSANRSGRASTPAASASIRSASRASKAPSSTSRAATRARWARATSTAVVVPARTRAAISPAVDVRRSAASATVPLVTGVSVPPSRAATWATRRSPQRVQSRHGGQFSREHAWCDPSRVRPASRAPAGHRRRRRRASAGPWPPAPA